MHHTVYVTTNVENGKFYIGKHSTANLDDGYCGSGIWVLRAKKKNRKLLTRTINFCDSSEDAYKKENEIVSIAKELWPEHCMNISDGGYGFTSTYPLVRSGAFAPMFGKKHSDATRKKFSLNYKKNWGDKGPMIGKNHSQETKKKMSESHLKIGYLRGKKVQCIENGIVYASLSDASRAVSKDSNGRNNIRKCIDGKISISYGFTWKFVD